MTVADIRRRKQAERLSALQQRANVVLTQQPGGSLWLFGSWARGDWDGFRTWMCWRLLPTAVRPAT
jgi:hypothetical protein